MKKLIAMIGAVATAFGLYATDLTKTAVSFETADTGCSGETLNLDDDALWSTDYDDVFKFGVYDGDAYGYTTTARRSDEFKALGDNYRYLKLSTGTNSLQRLFAEEGAAVDTDPIFMDQLVKFTGYEDTQTVFAAGTKVAVWMSEFVTNEVNDVEQTLTNLYVAVGKVAGGAVEVKNVKIDGEYKLDTWYRLTIRSIGNIVGDATVTPNALAGFAIYIDGQPITIVAEDRDLLDIGTGLIPKAKVLYAKGQLFPSMIAGSTTLKSVGFEGMGGIDDMIVDAVGPDFAQEANFTVTAPEGAAVTRVYNVDDEADLVADANGVYTVVPGTNIKIWLTADNSGDSKWVLKPDPTIVDKTVAAADKVIDLSDEVAPESAVVQVVIGDEDAKYFSELGDAFAFIDGTNATVSVEMLDEGAYWITEGVGYAFFKGTTIDINPVEEEEVLDGVWNLYVDNAAEDVEKEISATDTFGVMPEKVINVTFNEGGFLKLAGNIYGYGRKDAEINVDGATTLAGALTIGAAAYQDATGVGGATLKTDTLVLNGNKITLRGKGKVMVKTELTVADAFTNPEKDIKGIPPAEVGGYYTYTLKGGVEFTITTPANATITNVEGAEKVSGNTYTAEDGATVTVTLTADEGYLFENETDTTTETFTAADGATFAPTAPAKAAAKKGLKFFITLQDALDDTEAEGDITLCDNLTITEAVVASQNFVLDLNGKTVTGNWTTSWATPGAGRDYIFELGAYTAVVSNGTVASTANNIGGFHTVGGSLTFGDNTLVDTAWRAVGVYNGATLNVGADATLKTAGEDPTIFIWSNFSNRSDTEVQCDVTIAGKVYNTFNGVRTSQNLDAVIMGNGNDKFAGVKLTVEDGAEIEGTACAGIYFPCAGELAIGAATITGTEGVYVKGGASTVIDGAIITATGAKGTFVANHDGHAWTGDAFVVDVSKGYPTVATQTVSGGKFTSANGAAIASYKEEGATADRVTKFVSGGQFKGAVAPATDLIVVGPGQIAKWTTNEQGYLVPDYDTIMIAKNLTTEKEYEWGDLQTAIDEATSGDTIQMIADFTDEVGTATIYTIASDKELTFDLNGKTISLNKTTAGSAIWMKINASANVVFTDSSDGESGKILFTGGEAHTGDFGPYAYMFENRGKLTFTGGTYEMKLTGSWIGYIVQDTANSVKDAVELNLLGGVLNQMGSSRAVRFYNNSSVAGYTSTFTINGGVIQSGGISISHDNGNCTATFNMLAGEINGKFDCSSVNDNLTVNINGGTCNISVMTLTGTYTKPAIVNVTGGNLKIDNCDGVNAGLEITGGTFTSVEETDEKLQTFVPAYCDVDDESVAGKWTVSKIAVPLTVLAAEGVETATISINGDVVGEDVTATNVVFGDEIAFSGITYAEGYEPAGDVTNGYSQVVTAADIAAGEVEITIGAKLSQVFGGGTGIETDPYIIETYDHLVELQAWVLNNDSTGVYFKQTEDIVIDAPWTGISEFKGVYDGDSNALTYALTTKAKRQGFFSKLTGGTVQNLVITWNGFVTPEGDTENTEFGGSAVVGYMDGGVVSNIVVNGNGTPIKCAHNVSGIVNNTTGSGDDLIIDCVNNATFESYTPAARTDARSDAKIAGIVAQCDGAGTGGADVSIIRCTNNGAITFSAGDTPTAGSGGIVGWSGSNTDSITIKDCSSTGVLTDNSGVAGARMASIIGFCQTPNNELTCEGNTTTLIGVKSTYDEAKIGLTFATVADDTATFVADDALADKGTYKVMVDGAAPVVQLTAANESITFVTNLCDDVDFAGITVSDDKTLELTEVADANGVTFTAVAKATEPIPPLVNPTQADIEKVFEKAADPTLATKVTPENYSAFRAWTRTLGTGGEISGEEAALASPKAFVSFQLSPIVEGAKLFTNEPAVKFTAIEQGAEGWNATLQIKDGATGEEVKLAVEAAAAAYQNFVKVGTVVTDITQAATIKATEPDGNRVILTVTPPTGDKGFIKFTTAE